MNTIIVGHHFILQEILVFSTYFHLYWKFNIAVSMACSVH